MEPDDPSSERIISAVNRIVKLIELSHNGETLLQLQSNRNIITSTTLVCMMAAFLFLLKTIKW